MTKKYQRLALIFTILSVLLYVGPFATYVIMGLCGDALITEKIGLVATIMIVGIMTMVAAANKMVLRSRLWILLIGLYACLDNILTPLIIVAVCQVVDELIVSPLAKMFRDRATINGELDKRLLQK